MGRPSDHRARADANEELGERLSGEGEFHWGSTLLFYAALHLVCALLAERNKVATDGLKHIDIEAKVDKHYPGLTARYLAMFGESRRCRYVPDHSADKDSYRRMAQHLKFVRDYCDRALAGKIPGA